MKSQCDQNFPDGQVTVQKDGIHLDGPITGNTMLHLLDRLDEQRDSTPTVWLESGGGQVDAALHLALMISHRNVRMAVGHNAYCGSACVILFLAADESRRYAAPTAAFGLHGVYCPNVLAALEFLVEESYTITAENYTRFMRQTAPDWYAKAVSEHAFKNPPDNLACYTFPDGADHPPVSERESNISRGNCQMAVDALGPMVVHAQPPRPPQGCPEFRQGRIGVLLRYYGSYFGPAQDTSRHTIPVTAPPPKT
jgi:hypothetical protein